MPELREVTSGLLFPEGPVAHGATARSLRGRDRRGAADPRAARTAARRSSPTPGGGPNGAAIGPDGTVLHLQQRRLRLHRRGRRLLRPMRAGRRLFRRADRAHRSRRPARSRCSTRSAPVRPSCAAPTTSSSTLTAASTSPTSARCAEREMDRGARLLRQGRRLADPRGRLPDGDPERHRPLARRQTLYVAETEAARLWAFDIVEPGVLARHPWPSPHGGRLLAAARRHLPALRFACRRGERQHLRRHVGARRDHHRLAPMASSSSTSRCPTCTPPTSASAAPISAPPTSPSPAPAASSPAPGPAPASG